MSESTCKHGVWKGFVCRGCRHDEHTQAVIDRFYDSDKDGEHNGGSGLSPPTELDRLRAQIAARDRELAHLRASHSRLHDYFAEKFGECPAVWTVGNGSPAAFLAPTNKETE